MSWSVMAPADSSQMPSRRPGTPWDALAEHDESHGENMENSENSRENSIEKMGDMRYIRVLTSGF